MGFSPSCGAGKRQSEPRLASLFWVIFVSVNGVAACDSDKSVLLELKKSVRDASGKLANWNPADSNQCSFAGVICDASSRVISLDISGEEHGGAGKNNESGHAFLPSNSALFSAYGLGFRRKCKRKNGILAGKLPRSIARLSKLRVLSLPFNAFHGEIPSEIWGMKKLEILDLEGNFLSGTLPLSFLGLRKLRVLNLGFNKVGGEIPESFSHLRRNLKIINLAGNHINGTVPGYISKFRDVYLFLNQLGGSLPREIGERCEKLKHLDLSGNYLSGRIPSSLGNCGKLQTLLLYSNLFEEAIPSELGMLRNLRVLDVSRNSLVGSLPRELGNCSQLSVLVLSNPYDPYQDHRRRRSAVDYLPNHFSSVDEDFNYFEGDIPKEISSLPNLRILWLPAATLQGKLSREWRSCDSLEMINLASNFFTGNIPVELKHCRKLLLMDLSSNRLEGRLDEELRVPCMSFFDVSDNSLSGSIPKFKTRICREIPPLPSDGCCSCASNISSAYLSFFYRKYQERFSVQQSAGGVVVHNLGNNKFSGNLQSIPSPPVTVRSGKKKRIAYAFSSAGNELSGDSLGILFENCDDFHELFFNISGNNISDCFPVRIDETCRSIRVIDASRNQISGRIPSGFSNITSLKHLSLASNQMNGSIPSSLGKLQSLELLDLSSNLLSGEIPEALASLKNLTVLLLNDNKLSGRIPSSLANMTTLSAFNASFNNLSGPLPLHYDSMKCSSVLGNPYLIPCRLLSLSVPSPESHASPMVTVYQHGSPSNANGSETETTDLSPMEIASLASASAIVSVLFVLIILFFHRRKWRSWQRKSSMMGSVRKEVTIFKDIGVPLAFDNVVRATGGFNGSNCIGSGGFGATYRAEIAPSVLVAIKRLAVGRFQGVQQFHAEIKTLGRLHHPNLVTLIGYHASETEMFLIYNYLPGGNLKKFIQDRSKRKVDWGTLHKIALDIARALAYLHDQCAPRVLHRDVKPSNILLDEYFNAYLSDFGLARLLGTSETHATTGVAGTFGYVAPEYAMTCRVSDKADVYSYGVVLLELLSDKKALDPSFSSFGNGFNIVTWACMLLRRGRAKEFFTVGLWDAAPHDDLVEILHVAVLCTADSLSTRPTIKQVVHRLKQLLPRPC